jgi:hypothetical protein
LTLNQPPSGATNAMPMLARSKTDRNRASLCAIA